MVCFDDSGAFSGDCARELLKVRLDPSAASRSSPLATTLFVAPVCLQLLHLSCSPSVLDRHRLNEGGRCRQPGVSLSLLLQSPGTHVIHFQPEDVGGYRDTVLYVFDAPNADLFVLDQTLKLYDEAHNELPLQYSVNWASPGTTSGLYTAAQHQLGQDSVSPRLVGRPLVGEP